MVWLDYTEEEFRNLGAAEEPLILEVEREEGYQPPIEQPPGKTFAAAFDIVGGLVGKTEEEEHGGDHVYATDGDIGQLRAVSIDSAHQVTHVHVLLKEGHWWHHKEEVAIPADKVSSFDTGIHLNISKQQVQDLAHGDIDFPKPMKIATLKFSGRFTEDGSHIEYAEFDQDAQEDGSGQALLRYDNGRWELLTSEEEVDRSTNRGSHGYLQATDLEEAVREARQLLQSAGYEVAFKAHPEDPD